MNILNLVFGPRVDPEEVPVLKKMLEGEEIAKRMLVDPKARIFDSKEPLLRLVCRSCGKEPTGTMEPDEAMGRVQRWFLLHPPPEHDSEAHYSPERRHLTDRRNRS
jgi:hypothetical protein